MYHFDFNEIPMDESQPSRSLKIVQVCTSKSWGGMEMHVASLSELLQGDGQQVMAIADPDSRLFARLKQLSVPLLPIFEGGYIRPRAIRRAHRWLEQVSPDVVHVHFARDLWWLVPAMQRLPRVPLILTKHIGTQKSKSDTLHRHLYERVQTIIAISNVIRQNIIATHPVAPEKVVTLHHGVNLERFALRDERAYRVRKMLGLSADHVVIGIVGRLQRAKGYMEFLHMAAQLKPRYPHCRFLLVGEASRGEEAEAREILNAIPRLGLQDRVFWLGFREDVPDILAAMDIFVFPSHAEAFGLVLIEAMAVGLPVVSSRCDGVLDVVVDRETGFLVPPKNVEQLVQAVTRLIEDRGLRERMGLAGRRRVEMHFDQKKMLQRLKEIYAKPPLAFN